MQKREFVASLVNCCENLFETSRIRQLAFGTSIDLHDVFKNRSPEIAEFAEVMTIGTARKAAASLVAGSKPSNSAQTARPMIENGTVNA